MENDFKLLIIPGYRIFPVDSGGAFVQTKYLAIQQYQYELHLIVTPDNIYENDLDAFKKNFPEIIVHTIGFGKKGLRGKAKKFLKKQYRKITGKDAAYALWKSHQLHGLILKDPEIVDRIAALTHEINFDIIQVEHVKNLALINVLPSHVKKIFIHHEIYYTRVYQDMKSLNYPTTFCKYISDVTKGLEIASLNNYNGIITLNEEDKNTLQKDGVATLYHVAPAFTLSKNDLKNIYDPHPTPKLVFLGGETHYPNKEGLLWFLKSVTPILASKNFIPRLYITGKWSDDFITDYKNETTIFTGYVEDLQTILTDAIIIVPIRIGSGIRVKVFTSMAMGLPIVSTTMGASGVPGLLHKTNIMLANDEEAFAQSIIDLLTNMQLRQNISDAVFKVASKYVAENSFAEGRNEFYQKILAS